MKSLSYEVLLIIKECDSMLGNKLIKKWENVISGNFNKIKKEDIFSFSYHIDFWHNI